MTIVTVLQPGAPSIVTALAAGDEAVVLRTALAGAVKHTVTTLNAGTPGPAGPPGGSNTLRTAAQALGGHRVVYAVAPDLADYADRRDATQVGRVIGVTLGAAASGAEVEIARSGPVSNSGWSWVQGESIWLGIDGLLTQSPPETDLAAQFGQRIGIATLPTQVWVDLSEPILL